MRFPPEGTKGQTVAGWRRTKHLAVPDQGLPPTRSAGAPRLVISFQNRNAAPCGRPLVTADLTSSPCGQCRIDRTNTNFFGCSVLFRVFFLKCFCEPEWSLPPLGNACQGRCRPRAQRGESPRAHPWEAGSPRPFLLEIPVATAIPVAHSPQGDSGPAPRRLVGAIAASFFCLADRDPRLPLCC